MLPTSNDPLHSATALFSSRQYGPLRLRLVGLAAFLILLVLFRHLALMGVTFVVFARALVFSGGWVARTLGLRGGKAERTGALLVLLTSLLLLAIGVWLVVRMGGRFYLHLQTLRADRSLLELLQDMQGDLVARLPAWLPLEDIKERLPHIVQPAVGYLQTTGRVLMHVLVGLILAVIYVLDREPVDAMLHSLPSESFLGTLWRYFGYLSDAIVITITLQVLVALVNTVLTLPVLILLKLPRIPAFTALIFFSSLVPVVGNLLSGAVLIAASYVYRGVWAVVFFVITTFVLHKIEAYYLNPRLAAQHVKLPSLMLVTSLILHEHLFGIVGLFLSFPVLYVWLNILQDLRSQFSACSAPALAPSTPRPVPSAAVAPPPAPAPSTPSAPSKKRRR